MDQNHFWNLFAKKLTGEATQEEVAELEILLKENPDYTYSAQHLTDLWKVKSGSNEAAAETAFQNHLEFLNNHGLNLHQPLINLTGKPSHRKKWLVFFATLLLLLCVGSIVYINQPAPISQASHPSRPSEISTRPGNRTKLVLPDSSVVWLNAGSKLTYDHDFGVTNRNTTLIGEAFFDVKKSSVPFIIHANKMQVKVLGTAFNVKSYPHEKTTETSLIRGRVEITLDKRPGEKFVLKPNEKLVVANTEEKRPTEIANKEPIVVLREITHVNENTILETSWVDNKLVFDEESFEDVAKQMERWYGIRIRFKNSKLKTEHFTGFFEKETVEQALTAMQLTTPFQFSSRNDEIIIY